MTKRSASGGPHGFLLVDKPADVSSHDVVAHVRRKLRTKVGHAGTLDPFATGLLVVLVGDGTRLMQWVVGHDKRYDAVIRLGGRSSTDDRTGELEMTSAEMPTDLAVWKAVAQLEESIEQVPPGISALHIDGVRAYKRVRRGETIELKPRPVTFHGIRITEYDGVRGLVHADVRCSTGTYIRALARDLGELLETGAYLSDLRRTEVGRWKAQDAMRLDDIEVDAVRPLRDLMDDYAVVKIDERLYRAICDGRTIVLSPDRLIGSASIGDPVSVIGPSGDLVSVAIRSEPDYECKVAPVLSDGVDDRDQNVVSLRPRAVLAGATERAEEVNT